MTEIVFFTIATDHFSKRVNFFKTLYTVLVGNMQLSSTVNLTCTMH